MKDVFLIFQRQKKLQRKKQKENSKEKKIRKSKNTENHEAYLRAACEKVCTNNENTANKQMKNK